jgi:hypothetical protein
VIASAKEGISDWGSEFAFSSIKTTIGAIAGPTGFVGSVSVVPILPKRRHHFRCSGGLGGAGCDTDLSTDAWLCVPRLIVHLVKHLVSDRAKMRDCECDSKAYSQWGSESSSLVHRPQNHYRCHYWTDGLCWIRKCLSVLRRKASSFPKSGFWKGWEY